VEGGDFVVYGVCDVDGDGEPAVYRATRDTTAQLLTEGDVF
jgi:hypothetical protein